MATTKRLDLEIGRKGVYRFCAYSIQPYRLLKRLAVIFTACIDLGYTVNNLPQGNAPAVIAHLHAVVCHMQIDPLTIPHHILINAVVNDLFEQHINAVIVGSAIAQLANVHAWT